MSVVWVGSLCYTWWLSVFLEFMQQWLAGFAEAESPISVDVIIHLHTNKIALKFTLLKTTH